ncbi:MAG: type II secretion system protein GspG [Pirellulaceae bacterium]|nr:type II secretion system protein GspG [Pirellulaceae bacterium]
MNRRTRNIRNRRSAFTLVEVMLVLVIIAAIAGIAITNLGTFSQRANERTAKAKINVLKGAVDYYRIELNSLPPDLNALYQQPGNLSDPGKWMQFITEPVGMDPWGNPYVYKVSGTSYEIRSFGPDGVQSDDDILG